MTRAEITSAALLELEDLTSTHFEATDINTAFDEGYEVVALTTGVVESVAEITLTANQPFYDLVDLIPDYYRLMAVYSHKTEDWLDPAVRIDEIRSPGTVREFFLYNPTTIQFEPAPSTAEEFTVYYQAVPATLAGTDSPQLTPEHSNCLVDYITMDMLIQDLELQKLVAYFNRFQTALTNISTDLSRRTVRDRVRELACLFSPHRIYKSL